MKASTNLTAPVLTLMLLALLFATGAQAAKKEPPFTQADCADPTLSLEINTQDEIDNFPCTTVAGDLNISVDFGQTITNLPLNQLTRVEGKLQFSFASTGAPTSLGGLVNLAHVGSLSVKARITGQPDRLTDISGLASLTSIGPRNCQPALDPQRCFTTLALTSDEITLLPAWNIANDPNLEDLNVSGFPLTDPTEWDSVPVPSRRLSLIQVDLDTSQPAQLATLARLASQATVTVDLDAISNLVALPAMPNASALRLIDVALPDLSAITPAAFPVLEAITLQGLAGISPAELASIRDIDGVTLAGMTGLSGANPLAGLTGGSFRFLTLNLLSSVTTLTDLSSVTALDALRISDMDGLTDLAGLDNLTSIVNDLFINKCDNLQNVDALSSLASIGRDLRVEENPALQDLDGLSGVVSGTLGELDVFSNPQLTDISGLAGISGVSENVFVAQNAVTECDVLVKARLNPQPSQSYFVDPTCVYAAPTLTSSATALDFGSAPIGSTVDRSVTFQNSTGSISTTVDISAVSISGDSFNEYSVLSEDCSSGPLTGGSTRNSCTVNVRFTVTQQGVDNAQLDLTYTTSDNSTPQSFPVTLHAAGTGVTGDQLIPKDNLDFGQVELGASKTDTITIDNTSGSGPLTVSALTVTGDFTISDNSCGNTYPQAIAVGNTCDVSIQFAPSALGARSGLFTMDSDGATSPDSVNLLGSGVEAPAPVPNPTSLDFGDVLVGAAGAQQLVTVTNASPIGSLPLDLLSASGDFALQYDLCSGMTLTPFPQVGSACAVIVTFNPTTTGPATGTLTIPGASGYPAASVALAGEGLEPATLTASPTLIDFGVQTTATTLAVTVTNIGAPGQDAQIGTASVTGALTPQQFFIDADGCDGTTLASQATCQISVTFDPDVEGVDTGSLDIPYNSGRTLNVALSGRGGDPVDYITPASLSFGDVEMGSSSAPQTVTVTDNSGIALDIASVFSNDSVFSVQNDSCSGTTVAPNGSCTFEVVFKPIPVTLGHRVSTVEVISNSASSPDQVAVDGFGIATDYTVGGLLSGLAAGDTVVLQNNGGDDLALGADGAFTFSTKVAYGDPYVVTVKTQPAAPSETCTVSTGTGTMPANDINSVSVTCTVNTYTVGGTLTGLASGGSVVLQVNGSSDLPLTAVGNFVFPPLADGTAYTVTVATQPTGQTCTVNNGSGQLAGADISDVTVSCVSETYSLGGQLTGLEVGNTLVLQNNGGDDLILSTDGPFTFAGPVTFGARYTVAIKTQPSAPNQFCTVSNGSGTMPANDVDTVYVTCTVLKYTVGVSVSGLASGQNVSLLNNGKDPITASADGGPFAFPTQLPDGSSYNVTVGFQPDGQTCSVTNGSGVIAGATVVDPLVTCVDNEYTVGGLLSGLEPGDSVVLQNNAGDNLTLTADGVFTFASTLNFGDAYNVTVLTQPPAPSQTCTVTNGSGVMPDGNVNNVAVTCTVDTFTVGGTLTGLTGSGSVVLQVNGTLDLTLTADGSFVFPPLADGTAYAVTVAMQPTGQTCTVRNGNGQLAGADVSDVSVTCNDDRYTLGGHLSGLVDGDTVVLQNNAGDDLSLNADGAFTFNTPVAFGDPYAVTVKTQPAAPSETCTVNNGSGTMPANDVNDISVTCTVDTFTVGGALSGLLSGSSVVLQLNGTLDLTLTADGNFVFPPLADGTAYTVTVAATRPGNQECMVRNGSGTLTGANVSDVSVSCALFYEGIPALDRHGLLLLALLILGVGFVGVRRFA